ncbi:pyrroline-5-carboxylate reductase [Congregibacter variabilis]|uniref:Pyrroline-5-carboxylate reductase n=1 Tax=Congregibacter variabilis TaxID=3081200 RepID=A0ABZ0I108_9GAMM|nr:pyrroline-5-carboxylate reductase [Congregibacter sp. IMCC43200]
MNSSTPHKSKGQESKGDSETIAPDASAVQVLMLGCGSMGSALLTQWRNVDGFAFTVVSPSGLRQFPDTVTQARSPEDLSGKRFDVIVIGLKPQMIANVLPDYLEFLAPRGLYLSLAAGFSITSLMAVTRSRSVARIMPNLPVSLGKGVSGLYGAEDLNQEHRALINSLMASTGHALWVSGEDALDRVTAIAGSGPGYAFEFARAWTGAAQALGFSEEQSRALVLKTVQGAVEMALNTDATLDELRDRVTSKNGTTHAGLSALNNDEQLDNLLSNTLQAAYARAVELR